MKSNKNEPKGTSKPRRTPAMTAEGRESQLISLAMDCAEQQLLDGTASSQVIVHYLKLATEKERTERELLKKQLELTEAKTENLKSAKRVEELYADAIKAMKRYGNHGDGNEDESFVP